MKTALLLLVAVSGLTAQTTVLMPFAEFDLGANIRCARPERILHSTRFPTQSGLTFAVLRRGGNRTETAFVSGDLDGRIQTTVGDRVYIRAATIALLPRSDGKLWFWVESGRQGWLDLYDEQGKLTQSNLHTTGPESPRRILAARDDKVICYGLRDFHFENIGHGHLTETSAVKIEDFGARPLAFTEGTTISILADNGDLVLVNKVSGDLLIVDPRAKTDSLLSVDRPSRIAAVAFDSGYLYLLQTSKIPGEDATVLKTDLQGHIAAAYTCPMASHPERMTSAAVLIAVKDSSLYLADSKGRGERFHLPQ